VEIERILEEEKVLVCKTVKGKPVGKEDLTIQFLKGPSFGQNA